jgi:hypothetical protein
MPSDTLGTLQFLRSIEGIPLPNGCADCSGTQTVDEAGGEWRVKVVHGPHVPGIALRFGLIKRGNSYPDKCFPSGLGFATGAAVLGRTGRLDQETCERPHCRATVSPFGSGVNATVALGFDNSSPCAHGPKAGTILLIWSAPHTFPDPGAYPHQGLRLFVGLDGPSNSSSPGRDEAIGQRAFYPYEKAHVVAELSRIGADDSQTGVARAHDCAHVAEQWVGDPPQPNPLFCDKYGI